MADSITCPECGRTSWSPHDVEEGYCGNCHRFTGKPLLEVPDQWPDSTRPDPPHTEEAEDG